MTDKVTVPAVKPKRRPGRPRKYPLPNVDNSINSNVNEGSIGDSSSVANSQLKSEANMKFEPRMTTLHIPAHLPPPVQPASNTSDEIQEANHKTENIHSSFNKDENSGSPPRKKKSRNDVLSISSLINPEEPGNDEMLFNQSNCDELLNRCSYGSTSERNKKIMEFLTQRWREQIHNYHDVGRSLQRLSIYKGRCRMCRSLEFKDLKAEEKAGGGKRSVDIECEKWDHIFAVHFTSVKPSHCLFCQYESCTVGLWKIHSLDCGKMNQILVNNMKPAARGKSTGAIADFLKKNVTDVIHAAGVTSYQSGNTGKQQRLDALASAYWAGGETIDAKVENAKKYVKSFWEEQWSEYKRASAWVYQNDNVATLNRTCKECNRTYINESESNTHRLVIHHRNIMPMQCFFCDRRYCIKKSLRTHADSLHSSENIIDIIKEILRETDEGILKLGKALHTSWKRGRVIL